MSAEPAGGGGWLWRGTGRRPSERNVSGLPVPRRSEGSAFHPRHPLDASAHVSSRAKAIIVTIVLFSPILAEVIRKYVVWSNAVFTPHYTMIVVVLGLFLLKDTLQLRLVPQNLFTSASLVVAWACLQAPLTGVSWLALVIGISTYVIPVVALYLSVIAFTTTARLARYSFSVATAILIVSYGVGILQTIGGPDSALNYMPPGVENKIAGYAVAADSGLEIGFMVRPASIYMHTGKFGSIVAVLSLFRLFYMYSANYSLARIVAAGSGGRPSCSRRVRSARRGARLPGGAVRGLGATGRCRELDTASGRYHRPSRRLGCRPGSFLSAALWRDRRGQDRQRFGRNTLAA